ncbi:MAG: HNH endonuclease, partial [Pedobacter sp.]
ITARRGQKSFRDKLLKAYEYKCAVTGCDVIATLEACHIMPYNGDYTNHIQNGILLRSDIHVLFDLGLLTIVYISEKLTM